MRKLHPPVAAALGFIFPGGGQIYCGQRAKGAVILTVAIMTLFLCGFWNLYGAWSGWQLAKRLKVAPPLEGGRSPGLLGEVVQDLVD